MSKNDEAARRLFGVLRKQIKPQERLICHANIRSDAVIFIYSFIFVQCMVSYVRGNIFLDNKATALCNMDEI